MAQPESGGPSSEYAVEVYNPIVAAAQAIGPLSVVEALESDDLAHMTEVMTAASEQGEGALKVARRALRGRVEIDDIARTAMGAMQDPEWSRYVTTLAPYCLEVALTTLAILRARTALKWSGTEQKMLKGVWKFEAHAAERDPEVNLVSFKAELSATMPMPDELCEPTKLVDHFRYGILKPGSKGIPERVLGIKTEDRKDPQRPWDAICRTFEQKCDGYFITRDLVHEVGAQVWVTNGEGESARKKYTSIRMPTETKRFFPEPEDRHLYLQPERIGYNLDHLQHLLVRRIEEGQYPDDPTITILEWYMGEMSQAFVGPYRQMQAINGALTHSEPVYE